MADIQTFIGYYVLKNKVRATKRQAKILNIKEVGSICVLVDLTGIDSHEELSRAEEMLSGCVDDVDIVIFTKSKEMSEDLIGRRFYVLNRRDLNFLNIPKKEGISQLAGKQYDVMLLFNPGEYFPLNYLAVTLQSKLKISMNDQLKLPFIEFNLHINEQRLNHFIQVALDYLNQINKNSAYEQKI